MKNTIPQTLATRIARAEYGQRVNCFRENPEAIANAISEARSILKEYGVKDYTVLLTIRATQDGVGTGNYPKIGSYITLRVTPRRADYVGLERKYVRASAQHWKIGARGFSRSGAEAVALQMRAAKKAA